MVEGLKNYVKITTTTQKHVAYLTMREMENTLNASGDFIRVHKSFIIAKQHIQRVAGRTVLLTNHLEVPIGETFRQDLQDYIARRVILSDR
nr:LytTR family DNA-binding domain-containing protein [Pontibacter sp. HSC-14F20]